MLRLQHVSYPSFHRPEKLERVERAERDFTEPRVVILWVRAVTRDTERLEFNET